MNRQIVHVLDWHYVPRDLLARDLGITTASDLDRLFRKPLTAVRRVQQSQLQIIQHLIDQGVHHF